MKGHIRKRGKNSWGIVIDLGRDAGGKRKQKWHSISGTKREAQAELTRILHQLGEGTYIAPNKMTVSQYLKHWLENYAEQNVATKTYVRYDEICNKHLIPALGHLQVKKLQPLHIQEHYTQAMKAGRLDGKGGLSPQTVLHHHRVLSEALKQAVRWQIIVRNPAEAVEPPKPIRQEMRALDESETAILLEKAEGSRLYVPILLAVTCGLRRGELLGLRWKDVDLDKASLSITQAIEQTRKYGIHIKQPKSRKSIRTVALLNITVDALRTHQIEQKKERLLIGPDYEDNGLVLPRHDGAIWKPDLFTAAFRRFAKDVGLGHFRFHDLRHSHATQLLKQGIHPKIVSERLGHSTIAITLDTYSHVMPGMQEDAASKLNEALQTAIQKRS
jgi:integrase